MTKFVEITNPQFKRKITDDQKIKIKEVIRIFTVYDENIIRKYIFNLLTDPEFALNKMKLYPVKNYKKYVYNIYMEIINNKPELVPDILEDRDLIKLRQKFGNNPFILFRIVELKNKFLNLDINKKARLSILNSLTSKDYKTQKETYFKIGFKYHEIKFFIKESKLIVEYIKAKMKK